MEKNLQRWLSDGLITQEKYAELLEDYKKQKDKIVKTRTQITLYIIGAVLLGIGAVLFISANNWILNFLNSCYYLKILLILLLTISCLFCGYHLRFNNTKFPKLGSSLIFLSTILIGALYALIGQIYNFEANSPLLYGVWFLSIIPLAYIFKSSAINILSCVVFVLFSIFYYALFNYDNELSWSVLFPVILGSFLYAIGNVSKIKDNFSEFSLTYKMISIFFVFIALLIITFLKQRTFNVENFECFIPFYPILLFTFLNYISQKSRTKLLKIETIYFSCLIIYMLLIVQISSFSVLLAEVIANIFIISMITFLYRFGYSFEASKLVSLASKLLIIYLLVNYIRFGSEYLKGASFFIIGGIVLFCAGLYFEKTRKKIIEQQKSSL